MGTAESSMSNAVDPRHSALILIDFERDVFGSPQSPLSLFASRHGILANSARIAAACRSLGVPVVHVKVERRADLSDIVDYITDMVLEGKMKPNRAVPRLIENTPGVEFMDEVRPEPSDIVVIKRRVSAFYGTPLDIYLRTRGIDTLLFGGVITNMGVETSVRDAYDRNYQCVVLSDCCGSVPDEAHEYPIKNTFPRIARVMTADQAIGLMVASKGEALPSQV